MIRLEPIEYAQAYQDIFTSNHSTDDIAVMALLVDRSGYEYVRLDNGQLDHAPSMIGTDPANSREYYRELLMDSYDSHHQLRDEATTVLAMYGVTLNDLQLED